MSGQAPRKAATILVPVDFSEISDAGVAWAASLAREHGSRLVLVHALTLDWVVAESLELSADLQRKLEELARERLEALQAKLAADGLEASWRLDLGQPSSVILRAAAETSADLIVHGTRGLSGLRHLLLGSTAERVLQRATCPVLSVHPADKERHRPIRRLLLATDFSPEAGAALDAALELFGPLGAGDQLFLLHAFHVPVEFTAVGPYGVYPLPSTFYQSATRQARARLDDEVAALRGRGLAVEGILRESEPAPAILEEAEAHEVDAIVMGTHGRTGLSHLLMGSTAERVVQHADCPVLTFRREAELAAGE